MEELIYFQIQNPLFFLRTVENKCEWIFKIQYKQFLFENQRTMQNNIFVIKDNQPEDVPFEKSPQVKQIKTPTYQNVCYLTAIVICICLSTFYYGITLSMSSAITPAVYKQYFGEWASQSLTIGWLVGLYHIGGAFGALVARKILKYLSRRQYLLVLDIFGIIVTGVLQVNNIEVLMVMRTLQGFIVGANMAVVPLYINQITPTQLRGSQSMFSMILIVFGVVLDYVFKVAFIKSGVNPQFYWRFVFGFTGVSSIIQLICILTGFIPESPMSLIHKGDMDGAKGVLGLFNIPEAVNDVLAEMIRRSKEKQLQKIAKENGITAKISKQENQRTSMKYIQSMNNLQPNKQPVDTSTEMIRHPLPQKQPSVIMQNEEIKTQRVLSTILQMYNKDPNIQPEVKRILSEHHMKVQPVPHVKQAVPLLGILLGFQLHFMQQFSGIKMNVTETSIIFQNYNPTLSIYSPLIANIVQFVGSFLSIPFLKKFGRKLPTIGGNLALGIINIVIAVMFVINMKTNNEAVIYVAFVFINFFMVGYASTIGSVIWLYVTELMPTQYVPFASSMNWLSAAISVIATPYVLEAVGNPYPVFFFFGGILLVFFFFNNRYLVQTKGLTHDEIVGKLYEKTKTKQ